MMNDNAIKDEVPFLDSDWFNTLDAGILHQIRAFVEGMSEKELAATVALQRYGRPAEAPGHRNGYRDRRQCIRRVGRIVTAHER